MGARNAFAAFYAPAPLSQGARIMLTHMAWASFDHGAVEGRESRLYWGGWRDLAAIVGWAPVTAQGAVDLAVKLRVARALRELRDHGLIETVARPSPGTPAVYRLDLPNDPNEEKNG
jgi:hypothetical protein